MTENVLFTLGRFGPFDGELVANNRAEKPSYILKFGPLFVNARALRQEEHVQIFRTRQPKIIGRYLGTIDYSPETHAVSGELRILSDSP